jgi:hypothetical protein
MHTIKRLEDVYQTGEEMRRLVVQYWRDLGAWSKRPFCEFYKYVCELPYFDDPENVETVSRPGFLLNPLYSPRDCDDKAILCACWWHGNGVKCRFVASSTAPDGTLHHVFLQLQNGLLIDATFPENAATLGSYDYFEQITNFEPLTNFF